MLSARRAAKAAGHRPFDAVSLHLGSPGVPRLDRRDEGTA